jgi:hypothetical protein
MAHRASEGYWSKWTIQTVQLLTISLVGSSVGDTNTTERFTEMTKSVLGIESKLDELVHDTAPGDIAVVAVDYMNTRVFAADRDFKERVLNNVVEAFTRFGKGHKDRFEKSLLLHYPELFVHTWAYNDSDLKIIVLSHEREVWQDLSEYAKLINLFVKYLGV